MISVRYLAILCRGLRLFTPSGRQPFTLVLLLFLCTPLSAQISSEQQRFLQARSALERADEPTFQALKEELADYPLYPYLVYWEMRQNIERQDESDIEGFLKRYADLPLAYPLKHAWLHALAEQEQWGPFLKHYVKSNNTELRCHYHYAQYRQGQHQAAWDGAKKLWLVGSSQPDACDALFAAWEQAGGLSDWMRLKRIELALAKGNSSLALHLAQKLPNTKQQTAELWHKVFHDPSRLDATRPVLADTPENRSLIYNALRRLARKDPAQAAELWQRLTAHYRFDRTHSIQLHEYIALQFTLSGDPRAVEFFAQLPGDELSEKMRERAIGAALRHKRWKTARDWIEGMPWDEQQSPRWLYWQGRIYEKLNEHKLSRLLYTKASEDRSYYGFLAADRIGVSYNLEHKPLSADQEAVDTLRNHPGLVRARELHQLNLLQEARSEWGHAIRRMNKAQQLAAGKLADEWQWHDRALITLARADYFDDLEIRFPLVYSETIAQESQSREIDPSWVYAVARQESALIPDARSAVGAMGLMQVMPRTGREIAGKLKAAFDDHEQLLNPETNIRFGAFYLKDMLERLDGNAVLATAAYNAGPHRIQKWRPQEQAMDADIWIESIPFNETRKYVRRVLAYSVFYDQRRERPIKRLIQRMPQVQQKKTAL